MITTDCCVVTFAIYLGSKSFALKMEADFCPEMLVDIHCFKSVMHENIR